MTYVPLDAVTNLGRLNADIGQAARAEELYTVALTGVQKVFGDGSDWHKHLEHLLASQGERIERIEAILNPIIASHLTISTVVPAAVPTKS